MQRPSRKKQGIFHTGKKKNLSRAAKLFYMCMCDLSPKVIWD